MLPKKIIYISLKKRNCPMDLLAIWAWCDSIFISVSHITVSLQMCSHIYSSCPHYLFFPLMNPSIHILRLPVRLKQKQKKFCPKRGIELGPLSTMPLQHLYNFNNRVMREKKMSKKHRCIAVILPCYSQASLYICQKKKSVLKFDYIKCDSPNWL